MLYEGHKGFFRHLPNSNNFVGFFSINNDNNNNLLHLYSAFLGTQSALHSKGGGGSSSTTGVQHPPGWCDGRHSVPEHHHTPAYWWRGDE